MAKKFKFQSEKGKEKWHLFRMGEGVDRSVTGPYLELFGNRELVLEGCLGVYEYSDTYLKLRLKTGALILCGTELELAFFEGEKIDIRGKLSSIEFGV